MPETYHNARTLKPSRQFQFLDITRKRVKTAGSPRKNTKADMILQLRRKEGATIVQLAEAAHWQNHSIRGFLSGMITKKMGLTLESAKNEAGELLYRLT